MKRTFVTFNLSAKSEKVNGLAGFGGLEKQLKDFGGAGGVLKISTVVSFFVAKAMEFFDIIVIGGGLFYKPDPAAQSRVAQPR